MKEKTALEIAGEVVELNAALTEREEIVKLIGRYEGIGFAATVTNAAWVQTMKRLRDSRAHKLFGMDRDEFCVTHLHMTRPAIDKHIAFFEEYGPAGLRVRSVIRLPKDEFKLLAPHIRNEGDAIEIDGEMVPVEKKNAGRILEFLEERLAEQAAHLKDMESEVSKSRASTTKAKEAQKLAEEKAKRAEEALHANERTKKNWWAKADDDHRFLLDLEQEFDFLLTRIRGFGRRELSADNQERYLAFCQQIWAETHQVTYIASQQYGKGLLMPIQAELEQTDQMTSSKRSLVAEYRKQNPLK